MSSASAAGSRRTRLALAANGARSRSESAPQRSEPHAHAVARAVALVLHLSCESLHEVDPESSAAAVFERERALEFRRAAGVELATVVDHLEFELAVLVAHRDPDRVLLRVVEGVADHVRHDLLE